MTGRQYFSPVTQDSSLLSSRHVKVSSKAEAENEHDDFALECVCVW